MIYPLPFRVRVKCFVSICFSVKLWFCNDSNILIVVWFLRFSKIQYLLRIIIFLSFQKYLSVWLLSYVVLRLSISFVRFLFIHSEVNLLLHFCHWHKEEFLRIFFLIILFLNVKHFFYWLKLLDTFRFALCVFCDN